MRALDLPDLSRLIILVVDDNNDSLEMLGTFLRACGAHVLQASSALEALTYIDTESQIDVLITDVSMPHIDGVELVRRLRRHPARASIPAIALSGFPALVRTGFYEYYKDPGGFDAFLRKPADLDELCKTITTAIRNRRRKTDSERAG
jgi:two-component system CheB/CheR fusion protein